MISAGYYLLLKKNKEMRGLIYTIRWQHFLSWNYKTHLREHTFSAMETIANFIMVAIVHECNKALSYQIKLKFKMC